MNFLIKNGTLYDPLRKTSVTRDIAIVNGLIQMPSESLEYRQVIDASGYMVTPGLIDFHVHFFDGLTSAGVSPDAASFCTGVTTVVDGGSSGAQTYEFYRKTVMAYAHIEIYNNLLIASGGQLTDAYVENMDADKFEEEKMIHLFRKYGDNLKGLKMRLSNYVLSYEQAVAAVQRAKQIAERIGTFLVIHITDCPIPLPELVTMLDKNDVICHVYQNRGFNTCLDSNGNVWEELLAAKRRGVLFDGSNGWKNYDITIAQKAIKQNLIPDIISTDMNSSSAFLQPLHSLPRILSKYLSMGMSLEEVLDCVITTPARLIDRNDLATLEIGTAADLCIFRIKNQPVTYIDCNEHIYYGDQILVPQMVFKSGQCMYCQVDFN